MADIWDRAGSFFEDVVTGGSATKRKGARDVARAQQKAIEEGKGYLNEALGQSTGYQQPFYDMGLEQTRNLNELINQGAFDQADFSTSAVMPGSSSMYEDPGYQFRMEQGNKALLASLSKGAGGQYSPAAAQKLMEYNQGLASQEYGNMFDRQQTTYANQFNEDLTGFNAARQRLNDRYSRIQNMATMGQNAGINLSNIYGAHGSNMANLALDKGNVDAAKLSNVANINAGNYAKLGEAVGQIGGAIAGGATGVPGGSALGAQAGKSMMGPSSGPIYSGTQPGLMTSGAPRPAAGDLSQYFNMFGGG